MFSSTLEKVNTGLLTAIAIGLGSLMWGFFSNLATAEDLERETKARIELELETKAVNLETKEDLKELTGAVTEHIRKADVQKARVDTLLDTLDTYIKKNGG
jgi:DNA-binding PucR family transcriptional regulator